MLLTRRAFALFALAAIVLTGGLITPVLIAIAGVYVALLVIAVLADRRLSAQPADFSLRRIHDQRLSLGANNRVTVQVDYRGARPVRLLARDEFPPQFSASAEQLGLAHAITPSGDSPAPAEKRSLLGDGTGFVPIAPGGKARLRYSVRPPRRGDYRFGDLNLRWLGVLGLVVRQASFPAAASVAVYPNLLDIRKYDLLARRGMLQEMGLRRSRRIGAGSDFERLREYQNDDEFRRIDWKATARRGKPTVRQFETERSQNIVAAIDVGRLMSAPVDALEKVDYCVNAALMLSYVAGMRGDRVGLLAFADDVQIWLSPKSGKGQFYRMLAQLYALQSQPVEADYGRAFAYLSVKLKKRSLLVVMSDLAYGIATDSVVAQMAQLRQRHLPLLVTVNDPQLFALAGQTPVDSATTYQRALAEQVLAERALTLDQLRHRGVLTLDVPANQLSISVVNRYLELKSRGVI